MLDIQFIRENKDLIQKTVKAKNISVDIEALLGFYEQRKSLLSEIEALRQQRNELTHSANNTQPSAELVERGKILKAQLSEKEKQLGPIEQKFQDLLSEVPNVIPEDTPLGGEEANRSERKWGKPRQDKVIDHLEWGEKRGLIDFARGAKVAGNKFYYLKGPLVKLELAVLEMALDMAEKQGFTGMLVPHLVNTRTIKGTGFLPRGDEKQIYKIEGEDLNLIATAEIPLTGYHADEVLDEEQLPVLYAGLSPAYRMEAGAYGKHSRGLYRTHQFNKLELYVFCAPEDSEIWHDKLVRLEESLCQALEIPYQVVRIAAGDLGGAAYKKFDIEYWSPVDNSYHELMSCSNVTDYQSRRLNIRYRDKQGKIGYVHTLNGTSAAMSRIPIALIENHQQADGAVRVPTALQQYLGGKDAI